MISLILLMTACAPGVNELVNSTDGEGLSAGFWKGLWHGMIIGITFIISLFNDNVAIYEIHNNGHLYDFGYLIGVFIIMSGSAGAGAGSKKRSRKRCC